MIRLLRHDPSVLREEDGAVEFRILASECFIQNLRLLRIGQFEHGWITCRKEEVLRRDISIVWIHTLLTPSYTFEQCKATLEENTEIQHCKTTCCYRDNFAEHIYHVGSSHDMHSIIQSGLIPGGKDVKKGRHAVFFTAVKPMFIDQHGERDYDVTKPRIAVYKHIWKIHQNTVYWCNLRVAQSNGLQFYQTRSNAIILYSTLPAVCIEKVVIRKSGEELCSKTYQSPTWLQRIVLKPNLHYGRQDTTSSDARTSFDHSSKHRETCGGGTYKETCRCEIDFRMRWIAPFDRQEQDHTRKEAVQKVDSPVWDVMRIKQAVTSRPDDKTSAFNPFSENSNGNDPQHGKHGALRDLRDHTTKHSAPTLWHTGRHVFYSVHAQHAWRLSDKVRKLNKDLFDVLSIPNYVIKKEASYGARHGNTERQIIWITQLTCHSQEGSEKGLKSILDRFLNSPRYRGSLTKIGWDEERCARNDAIAAEDHSYFATAAERFRRENAWVFVLTARWTNVVKTTTKPSKSKSDNTKSMVKVRQDVIPVNKLVTTRWTIRLAQWSESTPKLDGGGTSRIHQQALLPQDGNRLRGGILLHGHRHQIGVNEFFQFQGVSLTSNGDSLESDGRCKHYTKPTHM